MKYIKRTLFVFFMILYLNPLVFSKSYNILKKKSFERSNKFSTIPRGYIRIKGYIHDKDENPLENALITATHEDKIVKFKSITNKKGEWFLKGLGSGEFQIDVTLKGYLPYKRFLSLSKSSNHPFPIKIELKKPTKEELIAQYKKSEQLPEIAIIGLKEKLLKAEKLFEMGRYDKALLLYNYVLEIAPKVYQIIFKVADCYRLKGHIIKAIKTYKKGITLAIEREDELIAAKIYGVLGSIFLKANDLKKATFYFEKSLDMAPRDEIIAYNLAEFNFDYNNQKIDIAITYYKMAIKIKPSWAVPYRQLGYAYLNKDDRKNAVRIFKEFLDLDPNSKYAKSIKKIITHGKIRRRRR